MDFSAWIPARIDLGDTARRAELAGFDSLHLYDSQTMFAEVFSSMAVCASATSSLRIGAGVHNPVTRMSPVMANGLATINRIAPGRTFFAIGTGYTSMKTIGLVGGTLRQTRTYVEQVQGMLRGEVVDLEHDGRSGRARILSRPGTLDDTFMNTADPIPTYLAAGGPKGYALAGEIADGLILSIKHPRDLDLPAVRGAIAVGAERSGRSVDDIGIFVMLNMYVLEPGEDRCSRQVRESVLGVWQSQIGSWAARRPPVPGSFDRITDDDIPVDARAAAIAYRNAIAPASPDVPHPFETDEWPIYAYEGHAWRSHPSAIDAVGPDFLAKRAFIAEPQEIVAQIREWEAQGVTSVGPQLQHDLAHAAEAIDRVGRHIIPEFS